MKEQNTNVRVKAKNTMLAVEEAARLLNIRIDQVKYDIVSENRGLLGIFGRKVEIMASATTRREQGRRQGASQRSQDSTRRRVEAATREVARTVSDDNDGEDTTSRTPARALSAAETENLVEELRLFFAGIAERIAGQPVDVTAEVEDGRLALDADCAELAEQIARYPKLPEALENVVRKKPRHLKQELPFRVFVDAQGVRRNHETGLVQMAREMSDKVFQSKRPIVLPNRSAYDRKIIHMTLDRDSRVFTKSVGSGNSRKLMIVPSRDESAGV